MNILDKWKNEKISEKLKNIRFTKKQTMMMVFFIVGILFIIFHEGAESKARRLIIERLYDPYSVKFGKFTIIDNKACLTYNARNRYGGYVGEQQAFLVKSDNTWLLVETNSESHDYCVNVLHKMKKE